jgi:hypothetical protein
MPQAVKKDRPAEKPEYKVVPMRELRRVMTDHNRVEALHVPGDTYDEFASIADMLKLPADLLAGLVLDAFNQMADEDHSVQLPLMFQQVTTD